ncbi:bifunctional tRNA (adenosine(37)-N6)-threonylcarbamoyltransferase complex ATPase subunit type 1 TsaE/phosphotransferase [Rhizobium ruizarguesonis]|uniref:bifunctional tRNA (adenosine(37)-N6)-threonylcarbamoyltransferase complex ATPase subunit type 1 TsaE/phosphotransferase n=1 Tax=Rhizobium ruizarguesonis TaxID=2081791 RepID=UPI000369E107|nr:bifunctional tRNA (adenosine(37)-N6)-threonylcarbamoyltransferase complex ATPase subunit type 1 TsaE/phosphotransferase [Rhizobium ruizarguesonis]MBY5833828.1 bifunctional tRNA (adenosine(37)-N6)-threonylcarbamoyltransferase complex ATPase subunit type 1 TsaE/phosphotransferase [Rhizobium leguminosarum]QJS29966.1 bifunctional tRNA (adenosine(37)-N6)-threonylcarbamoyltransferase complex ATPase subunit type 1 TsaE/phosphotransferase [Rhizobium leguminosarum bv. trifolii TA1]MBY5862584.1 bifunct
MTTSDAISLFLKDEAATIRLGEDLALALKAGDCLALSGDLGAGKSSLARAILRAMADDEGLEVPSPTFTLVQSYDLRIAVSHFDLYRLADPAELTELGFDEALQNGICLVEWPEMAESELPAERIALTLVHEGNGRRATIRATSAQASRIRRVLAIREFLDDAGYPDAKRRFLTGDASLRAYEYVYSSGVPRKILMDWRPHPEGPPVYDGKPYPKVAHLAQNAYPFVAIADVLRERGFATPEIYRVDYEQGILLIEDLGAAGVLDENGQPIAERYRQSVTCLAHLHSMQIPQDIPVSATHTHHIPDFDRTAMKMEVQLVLDWHVAWKRGTASTDAEREEYLAIWDHLIDELQSAETNLLLRDFHSPNIIWREHESGIRKIGLIDFQDAMIGPTAYDLASIVQDARVTIEPELFRQLMDDYLTLRRAQGGFDEAGFMKAWAIMSAQRNCKLAGLWVRLLQRDGKPGYLKHMPRTLSYLNVALEHETLAPLRDWCARAGIGQSES